MQPPIGVSDFRKLIETKDSAGRPYLFVDKSLFIKEMLDDLTEVKLITRPRRFGKTLNMSMLHHFFASEIDNNPTRHLFENLKIAEYPEYIKNYQGKYPVVYMTFKEVKGQQYEDSYRMFCKVMSQVYLKHEYLLSSNKLAEYQKEIFKTVIEERATESSIKTSLLHLTHALYLHHGIKPWVLIDEYDTPIHTAYSGKFYPQMVDFMRGFYGGGLKDNSYLEKAVLTGILRVSKESIFSGLNNIITYSLLHNQYGEYFGFTESEVVSLLEQSKLSGHLESVRDWYNGYQMGNKVVYNPWSIVNYIKSHGKLEPYWVNASDNALVRELIIHSNNSFKSEFEALLQGKTAEVTIDENIVFNDIETNDSAVWSLLLMSGYLKIKSVTSGNFGPVYQLKIPNKEVKDLYNKIILGWLSQATNVLLFNLFIENLLSGKMDDFTQQLKSVMLQSMSIHDIKGKEPEKFFHGFMLGLLAGIDTKLYQVQSNKESGYGRFDIAIIPNDSLKLGIIFEIKSLEGDQEKDLKNGAQKALQQIDELKYDAVMEQNHIKNILKIGVAFNGKSLAVQYHKVGSAA